MNRNQYATALAITAAGSLAIFAGPATAWDDLPCGPTEDTAHPCVPGELARDGTIPVPLPPAPVVVAPLSTAPPATPTPPVVVVPPATPKVTHQKPRLTCAQLRRRHAGVISMVQRHCALPKRPPIVAGEYRATQAPAPGTIVSRLLSVVPALAEDTPGPASSISVAAGGKSATGTMDAAERGRLVPRVIPGHPWSTTSRSPHRGVVASVSWRSGRLTVSVLYSASRGRSTTSVSAR
jgi:hypothetical protein